MDLYEVTVLSQASSYNLFNNWIDVVDYAIDFLGYVSC